MRLRRPDCVDRVQARALSAHWDEVARRAPAEPVPPAALDRDLASTVRHLSALPGDAVPDPRFADQLLDRLAAVSQERTAMSTASPVPISRDINRTPDRWFPAAIRPFGPSTAAARRWPAVAITLVAAVVVAALWGRSLRGDTPLDRRDTTAIAAAGPPATMAAAISAASPALSSANVPVAGGGSNSVFFTAVVDLSGPGESAWLWVIPVVPKAAVLPPVGAPYLVMPLTGDLRDRVSGAPLYAGQAFAPSGTEPWELTNDAEEAVDVLILTGSDAPPNVVTDVPTGYQTSPLGKLTFDPAQEAALLEVTRSIGPESTTVLDTGRDGIAIVRAEHSPTIVDILAGEGALQRYTATGTQAPGYEPGYLPTDQVPATVYMAAGDVLTITGGAAAQIEGQGTGPIPTLIVTLRFDSARLQSIQPGVIVIPASTNAAGTPIAPAGCGIGRWTEDELRQRLATPSAGPLPSLGFGLADGVPADVWTTRDIDAAADRLASCVRTNDPLRYSRLWSADGLRFFYSLRDLDEDLAMEVLPDESVGMVDATVQDVRVHPDGRVSAVVDLDGEIAYVVWVREDGVWLVELFNDAIFAGPQADVSRCDTAPLRPFKLDAIAPATLTPAAPGGSDISAPLPEGTTPGPVVPGSAGADVAEEAVGRLLGCLVTLDPARIYPLATDAFRTQWAGVVGDIVPLDGPNESLTVRFPLAVPTITSVDTWSTGGDDYIGITIIGSPTAYVVLKQVDGGWLIDGWAPL